jgi:chromosome segregation ATPase
MKCSLYWSFLVAVVVVVLTNGVPTIMADEDAAAAPDCEAICRDKVQSYVNEQAIYLQEKASLTIQLQDATAQRDTIAKELQHAQEELRKAQAGQEESRVLLETAQEELRVQYTKEIEELQKSITLTKEEMTHYQKVAQDNQKYMQEYKNQLHSQRDKANKLSEALNEANATILELESKSLLQQLRKEVALAWEAIQKYIAHLTNKGKSPADAEF